MGRYMGSFSTLDALVAVVNERGRHGHGQVTDDLFARPGTWGVTPGQIWLIEKDPEAAKQWPIDWEPTDHVDSLENEPMYETPANDYVTVPRAELLLLFDRFGLPPWTDADGSKIGVEIDCGPLVAEMLEALEALVARTPQPVPPDPDQERWKAEREELKTRRIRAGEHEALLSYLCAIAGVGEPRYYMVSYPDVPRHPDDPTSIMVEDPEHPGQFRLVQFGADSDVAILVDRIREWRTSQPYMGVITDA